MRDFGELAWHLRERDDDELVMAGADAIDRLQRERDDTRQRMEEWRERAYVAEHATVPASAVRPGEGRPWATVPSQQKTTPE